MKINSINFPSEKIKYFILCAQIKCFEFAGLKFDAIGLVLDKSTDHTLEAFVRFETSDDFDLALKRNWEIMGNR